MTTVRRERIGRELRRLRGAFTSSDVQRALGITPSKLSRIEAGKVEASPSDVRNLATYYGASAHAIEHLTTVAEELHQPTWWTHFVGSDWDEALGYHLELETEANKIESWTIDLVPGLLQVPSYITALVTSRVDVPEEQLNKRLELRARRQDRVRNGELELWAVVDELVLHREIGGREVLADQLQHLADAPKNVTVQILPFTSGSHSALGSSFHILHFRDWPPVVYQDTITKGLYQDTDEVVDGHERTMNDVRATAASPKESRSLLTQRIAELKS